MVKYDLAFIYIHLTYIGMQRLCLRDYMSRYYNVGMVITNKNPETGLLRNTYTEIYVYTR